ncbi:MAG TPA: hypothetical protein VK582_13475 [Pyrinomonadaceae bacterium]|nr:hypothetical protein [Pyrinomonadaceae bacterium]
MKKLSWLISGLLLLGPALQTVSARQQTDKQKPTVEQIKIQVTKLGVGEKARATITTKDGTKTKGYVDRTGDEDFVMRDRKINAAITIRYADVKKIDRSHGHSLARNILIGVSIGTAAVVIGVLAAIARNER